MATEAQATTTPKIAMAIKARSLQADSALAENLNEESSRANDRIVLFKGPVEPFEEACCHLQADPDLEVRCKLE